MRITLDRLPFDVLFIICSRLRFDDIVHLSFTCRQLHLLLFEGHLCRKTVEAHARYSLEAALAQEDVISYGEAVRSIYARRDAWAAASPFSVRNLGQANSFLYRAGLLCILKGTTLEILSLINSITTVTIELTELVATPRPTSKSKYTLLSFNASIVAVHYQASPAQPGELLVISTVRQEPCRRLIAAIPLESSRKLFVRHNADYLYHGTHSGERERNRVWELRGFHIKGHPLIDPKLKLEEIYATSLYLEEFFGNDIGSTTAFEIHDEHFYALSNQTGEDVEELDWTSFYHCVRFPLCAPVAEKMESNRRIYRRQHAEGPIHDSWTDLSIQFDEKTNESVIVEARKEWQNGSTRQFRAFYLTKIEFDDLGDDDGDEPSLPEDDPLVQLLTAGDKPNYAPWQPRRNWNVHSEFGNAAASATARSFLLAQTKLKTYNYSSSAFLDLVEDDRCCPDTRRSCLRIRVGSRRAAPPEWENDNVQCEASRWKGKEPLGNNLKLNMQVVNSDINDTEPDETYRYSDIKLWPPPASHCPCAKRLHDIMNPHRDTPTVAGIPCITGVVDEGSLVYMVKPRRFSCSDTEDTLGTVVLVSFDDGAWKIDHKAGAWKINHKASALRGEKEWYWRPGQGLRCSRGEC